MRGTKIEVTLERTVDGKTETRTVEVTGSNHTQESAEKVVAHQYGDGAMGNGKEQARQWKVVPKALAAVEPEHKPE